MLLMVDGMWRRLLSRWCTRVFIMSIVGLLLGSMVRASGARCTNGSSVRVRGTITFVDSSSDDTAEDDEPQVMEGDSLPDDDVVVSEQRESHGELSRQVDDDASATKGVVTSVVSVVRDAVYSMMKSFSLYCYY